MDVFSNPMYAEEKAEKPDGAKKKSTVEDMMDGAKGVADDQMADDTRELPI